MIYKMYDLYDNVLEVFETSGGNCSIEINDEATPPLSIHLDHYQLYELIGVLMKIRNDIKPDEE